VDYPLSQAGFYSPFTASANRALSKSSINSSDLADGLFEPDGTFERFTNIDQALLTERFGERVLATLRGEDLISDNDVAQILSQEHTGFSVWLGDPFEDAESDRFVARYIERGPVSLEKLSLNADRVIYTTTDGTRHDFDGLEFLAKLSIQIPRPYEALTRFYGHYSCRTRGEQKKRAPAPVSTDRAAELPAKASATWAQCIKRIYEVDPLQCPSCGATMRIVAFLQDTSAIKKIMDSLGVCPSSRPRHAGHTLKLHPSRYTRSQITSRFQARE